MSDETTRALDALHVPVEQQIQMLEVLKERARSLGPDRRRAARRYRYAGKSGVALQVEHPGGSKIDLLIFPRDLSELGLGFFHISFLYPQSTCTIWLRNSQDQLVPVFGRITRCELVKGRVHDVGLAFDKEVPISSFADICVAAEPTVAEPVYKWRRPREA